MPASLFYCYSHQDKTLRDQLETHLSTLKHEGLISAWQDRMIPVGTEWSGEINEHLKNASVVLLLVTANFLASDYCNDVELSYAMERHQKGEARVIPVILRPCDWKTSIFAKLQALPTDGKPVISWKTRDDAFLNVVEGIRKALLEAAHVNLPPLNPVTPPILSVSTGLNARRQLSSGAVEALKTEARGDVAGGTSSSRSLQKTLWIVGIMLLAVLLILGVLRRDLSRQSNSRNIAPSSQSIADQKGNTPAGEAPREAKKDSSVNRNASGFRKYVSKSQTSPVENRQVTAGTAKINSKDDQTYVWIPAGAFQMGCMAGETECILFDQPAHLVNIEQGFWIGQTEVTQAAYRKVIGHDKNPSYFKGDQLPVESVTWQEAHDYCEAVAGRLPTEPEWEYAARAGNPASRYGDLPAIAWYSKNSGEQTHPVGQKQQNAWNLYDMLGNVWEWVDAWQQPNTSRVVRGGSWFFERANPRAALRGTNPPFNRLSRVGFRCVWEVVP